MKTAVGVIFTAALGTALPHVDKSTTTFSSCNADVTNESKLPWVVNKGDLGACNLAIDRFDPRKQIEEACGTARFCDLFDPENHPETLKILSEVYGYASNTECLAAHGKLPWIVKKRGSAPSACHRAIERRAPRKQTEEACGTRRFCSWFGTENDPYTPLSERYGYASNTECLAAHGKLPWIVKKRGSAPSACHRAIERRAPRKQTEEACGTRRFCSWFGTENDPYTPPSERYGYASNTECLAAHEDAEENDDNNNTKGQLSLDGRSPSLTFTYATSQSSSDNWIGIWPKDDTQAPTWGSTTWDYAKESSGSLQLTPPSSMKVGNYKAYLLSSDRTILAFLSSFDYNPESLSSSSSVAFSVKTHYNTNCGGSVNNNVDIKPGNGVCVRTNCDVGSLEIPSVGSCPDGQVRISYWQNADCGGDWYGYGYGSRGTCRGLWSNGWGFKSLWMSCADPASDCMQQGTCTADPEPATEVCRAATRPGASLIG